MEVHLRGESSRCYKISALVDETDAHLSVAAFWQKHVTGQAESEGAPKHGSACLQHFLTTSEWWLLWIDDNFCFQTTSAVNEIYFCRSDLRNPESHIYASKMESGALKPVNRLKVREALSFAVACENVSWCFLSFFSFVFHRYRNNYARIKNGPVERFRLMDGETGLLLSARYRSSQGTCWSGSLDRKTIVLLFAAHFRHSKDKELHHNETLFFFFPVGTLLPEISGKKGKIQNIISMRFFDLSTEAVFWVSLGTSSFPGQKYGLKFPW